MVREVFGELELRGTAVSKGKTGHARNTRVQSFVSGVGERRGKGSTEQLHGEREKMGREQVGAEERRRGRTWVGPCRL